MTIAQLKEYIGKYVNIEFKDGTSVQGVLGYTPEFSSKFGYRKPGYFTLLQYDFKVSSVKKIKEI